MYLEDVYVTHRIPAPATTGTAAPGMLLISADTLRADAIGALGGPWPTPHLDRLVGESEVFAESWSAASWTKPAHGSLFTGVLPGVHGAIEYTDALHPAQPTLAEKLAEAGFATGAVVQDIVHLDPRFGFDRGFDDYRVADWSVGQMARHAATWIGAHRERPYFFFLHTFETHSDFRRLPYEAPTVAQPVLTERFDLGPDYGCGGAPQVCASERLDAIRNGTVDALAVEPAVLRFLYGESVRHLDAELGRLFDDLRALGVWDDLMVVLTSDHGESLLETPRRVLHGTHEPEVLRVPLIVKWPTRLAGARRAGSVRREPVSGLDVMPTLLAAADLAADGLPGSDLAGRLDAARVLVAGSDTATAITAERLLTRYEDGSRRDLVAGAGGWQPAAPDGALDAALEDILAEASRQRAVLDRLGQPAKPALTEEERARLRAFGYTDG